MWANARASIVMKMMKGAATLVGILLVGTVLSAHALSEKQTADIKARIKPAGSLCMEGDSSCGAVTAAAGGAKSPEDIYNSNCMACHATGAAGAPKFGEAAAWKDRIAKGMDTLYSHAISGLNAMPPRGLCMSCSDDDIMGVVDYIVEHSK